MKTILALLLAVVMANGLDLSGLIASLANDNRYRDENGQIDPTWLASKAPMQAALDRYQGLQNVGGLTDIGIAGPNTARAPDGSIVNYYAAGTGNGEYSVGSDGRLVSGSSQFDTNAFDPAQLTGTGTIGNGQTAFITPSSVKPSFTAAPVDTNQSWFQGLASLAPVAAGPIAGATGLSSWLTSLFGNTGGAAIQGALGSKIAGGNPLTGALSAGAVSNIFGASPASSGNGLSYTASEGYAPGTSNFTTTPVSDGFNVGGFGATGGNPMFEDLLGDFGGPGYSSQVDNWLNGGADFSGQINPTAMDDSLPAGDPGAPKGFMGSDVYGSADTIAKSLLNSGVPAALIKQLMSGGGAGLTGAFGSLFGGNGSGSGNSLLDTLLNGLGGTSGLIQKGIATAPILAALNYAQNQSGPDISTLTGIGSSIPTSFSTDISGLTGANSALSGIASQFNPEALTGTYDLSTGNQRGQLASDLARRGVSGSSFGNSDMTNFDTTRDLGRSQLIQGGLTNQAGVYSQQANIANQIAALQGADQSRLLSADQLRSQNAQAAINAQLAAQKNKNDLYGRSLLALGSVFSPSSKSLLGG